MSQVHFNPATHAYTLDGQHVPGVTSVLKDVGLTPDFGLVDPDVLDRACQLGRACDTMIELDVLGVLDVTSLDEELKGYYDAWQDFLANSGFKPTSVQELVHSAKMGYAGQLDLMGTYGLGASLNDGEEGWLIDTKRVASVPFSTRFQTAAYSHAWVEAGQGRRKAPRRYALQLKKEGRKRYSLIPYEDDPGDMRVFASALTVYNAKRMKK
jgi:hypothetical protein